MKKKPHIAGSSRKCAKHRAQTKIDVQERQTKIAQTFQKAIEKKTIILIREEGCPVRQKVHDATNKAKEKVPYEVLKVYRTVSNHRAALHTALLQQAQQEVHRAAKLWSQTK